jgi:acetate kinase
MGFTPLEGVPMTTRAGTIDPGILLYALRRGGLDVEELDRALNKGSGLAALAGGSGDMRDLEAGADGGDEGARLALAVYAHRVAGAVAAMAAACGGLDALAFTAGIGERSARVRALVCERLRFLGVELDEGANTGAEPDCDVAAPGSSVRVLVIAAREELVAARAARELLGGGPAPLAGGVERT